jgi:hypothetical protein
MGAATSSNLEPNSELACRVLRHELTGRTGESQVRSERRQSGIVFEWPELRLPPRDALWAGSRLPDFGLAEPFPVYTSTFSL